MSAPLLTEKDVRIFLMDFAASNPLLLGVRFTAEQIQHAIIFTVDEYNIIPPYIGQSYTVENFPNKALLLKGVVGHLLRGAAINEESNNLEYAAAGVQINDKNKGRSFLDIGNTFWSEFKEMSQQIKISQNLNRAWGSKPSEFRYRNISP